MENSRRFVAYGILQGRNQSKPSALLSEDQKKEARRAAPQGMGGQKGVISGDNGF